MWQEQESVFAEGLPARSVSGGTDAPAVSGGASAHPLEEAEQRPAVLVVAPVEATLLEVTVRLSASGHEVYTASTAQEALERAEQMPLDVILLDLDGSYSTGWDGVMISGFRLLYLLRRLTGDRPVALIVLTEMDYAEVEGVVRASADALVNRPLLPMQLVGRVHAALARARSRHRQDTLTQYHRLSAGASG